MLTIGLTGGIACGKSTVLGLFQELGCRVLDADAIARRVMQKGTPVWHAVRARFGEAVLRADGDIDRKRLAEIVFRDSAARRDLEALVHPRVFAEAEREMAAIARQEPDALVVFDVPLLLETGYHRKVDRVVVVSCRPETQMRRLLERGMSEPEARLRLAAQMPLEQKEALAHFVIRTDGPLSETRAQVVRVFQALKAAACRK